ncbi:YcxB family protein [uncultured Shewanella sp.]|uniref:YcxB family protein n=1 Tax=uncultured Shewanella sp. TaxID=173975 RepID=UPI0026387DE1|nr:YcxB family protein [uncultured Shewanella sp.]
MTPLAEFTCQYKLDRNYYIECYEESTKAPASLRIYNKSIIFVIIGISMLLTQLNSYASWFLIALGILEAFSIKFKKSWWLMRQMMSRSANSNIQLTINEQHIKIDSYYVNTTLLWNEINQIIKTQKGFVISHNKTRHYLSNKHLNEAIIEFINNKVKIE